MGAADAEARRLKAALEAREAAEKAACAAATAAERRADVLAEKLRAAEGQRKEAEVGVQAAVDERKKAVRRGEPLV